MTNFKDQFKLPNLVRICSDCSKEHNLDLEKIDEMGWSASHGYCVRHFGLLMKKIGLSDDEAKKEVAEFEASAPPCADLDDGNNKPLLKWLLNPTPQKQETDVTQKV